MHKEGYCLGFDFGLKKIGLAVGQFVTFTAQPIGVVYAKEGIPDWLQIEKIIKEWRPQCLVVGLPMAVDGSSLSVTKKVENFAKELKRFGLPVYLTDERMTTKEARSHLFESGGYRALKYGKVDSVAAAVILEQWMNDD